MSHKIYDNYFLSNEIEDQYNSKLNLQQFCTVDNSLVGTPGMLRKINRYRATDGTEKLTMGQGNIKSIEVTYDENEYRIQLAQNRFEYYDEQEMTDPYLLLTGTRHMATDMYNTVNADIYAEYLKSTQIVPATTFDFGAFVDAQSTLNREDFENLSIFAFVSSADVADIRKNLKDDLKYVTEFSKSGYIGTVGGVNIYTKADAVTGSIIMATQQAVTIFNKKGVEVARAARDDNSENIRKNTIFSRKYYLVALTDERYCVKIQKGATATASSDTTASSSKTYYQKVGNGYVAVKPQENDNPKTKGWFTIA